MSNDQKGQDFRIRKMKPEDLEQIIEIDQLCFSQPWPKDSFKFEMYNNPVARLWVTEKLPVTIPAVITGMMVIWLVIDEAHIGTIAVHPNFRRQGLGYKLLQHGLIQLQSEGAQVVYLEVRRTNIVAQSLYERFGFYQFDERKGYYQDNGEDALIFILDHLQTRHFS